VLAVRQWFGAEERLLLVNFGDTEAPTPGYGAGWRVLLDSGRPTQVETDDIRVAPRAATVLARAGGAG
jgi:hypothetical protein